MNDERENSSLDHPDVRFAEAELSRLFPAALSPRVESAILSAVNEGVKSDVDRRWRFADFVFAMWMGLGGAAVAVIVLIFTAQQALPPTSPADRQALMAQRAQAAALSEMLASR